MPDLFLKEIWRYPAKSMAGERLDQILVTENGLDGDRQILVRSPVGRIITARTHPQLLGLKGSTDADGQILISGHPWDAPEALALVRAAVGPNVALIRHEGPERFDVLPLLVATDGAIDYMGFDGRRLRPNLIIGGVEGLKERAWPGRRLQIGDALIHTVQLRGRCVMTTFHPDTLEQDRTVLQRIVRELDGVMALDSAVLAPGLVHEGDPVTLLD